MAVTRVVLVGLGGYGNGYVDAVLDRAGELEVEFAGAVDPAPSGCRRLDEIRDAVGTIHQTVDGFFAEREADLAVISAPIQFHAPFTITALGHGASVLCEKPVAGAIQDALAMGRAERDAQRGGGAPSVAIGYQWSFSDTIQTLRRHIDAGRFGVPLQLKTLVFWPRGRVYYNRSGWAGAIRTKAGWVLDSPVNNATAHYLHNMLFVLGHEGGRPLSVSAELARVNPIESFDTAALRVETASGAEVLFYTTHAVPSNVGPVVHYRFSEADVYCTVPGHFFVRFADGTVEDLGSPDTTHADKLAATARSVQDGTPVPCTIAEASHQLRVACGAHESHPILDVPDEFVRVEPIASGSGALQQANELRWVDGLQAAFAQAFAQGTLPSELGSVPWVSPGRTVDLTDYDTYPAQTGAS